MCDGAFKMQIEQRRIIPQTALYSEQINRKPKGNLNFGKATFPLNIDVRKERRDTWLKNLLSLNAD